MPIVIGLGDTDWSDPLNVFGGKFTAPEPSKPAPAKDIERPALEKQVGLGTADDPFEFFLGERSDRKMGDPKTDLPAAPPVLENYEELAPVFDVLGKSEGTDKGRGYNETLAYGAFTGGEVDLENMTIAEVKALQRDMLSHPDNSWNSSAVGRYQIVGKTLRNLQRQMGLPDDAKFDRRTQDAMAAQLIKGRGYDKWKAGDLSDDEFLTSLAKEWASLPTAEGRGYYAGQRASVGTNDVLSAFMGQRPVSAGQAAIDEQLTPASASASENAIVIDESFAASDPMGLMAGGNPFAAIAEEAKAARQAEETQVADQFEQNRITGLNQIADRETGSRRAELEAANPGRTYIEVDEADLPEYQRQWTEENGSTGRGGDFIRNWAAGAGESAQSLDEMGTLLINQIPGGEWITGSLEKIERWMGDGTTVAEKRAAAVAKADASRTAEGQEAAAQTVFKGDSWELGGALTDPDWYLAMIARSAPSMVVSMGPSGLAARGAFTSAIAAGAPEMAAAAAAARVATIGGGITEGILGGAETSAGVARAIAQIPRVQLLDSDAVKQLVAEGMSEDEAVRAVTEDAQLQGFITAGVATGLFGGVGDRALARIIGEGVGGNLGKRIVSGAARGAVAEGVFEELPQSVGQTIAQNAAVQRVDPNQTLTEGLAENAVAGLAVGTAMGGGMGAVAGGASPQAAAAGDTVPEGYRRVAPDGSLEPTPPPAPEPRGPIGRSVRHAEEQIAQRGTTAPADVIPAQATAAAPADGRPAVGSTVTVSADGIDPFMGTVQSYEGDEAVVSTGDGELFQVPMGSLSVNAPPVARIPDRGPEPINDAIPEFSTDPALEPMAPAAAEVRSEGLPPRSEQKEATERFPSAPTAGQRVIVDDENGGRFVATVQGYENGGTEALIRTDDGKDLQVPVSSLKVSKLTPKQVEAQELERNPPIEREVADAGPMSRSVLGKTIVMPDDKHARLFDLGKMRQSSRRTLGTSQLDLDRVDPRELKALANEFGIPEQAIGQLADDYATRMVRNVRSANSKLPQRMPPVMDTIIARWRREVVDADTSPAADETQSWWDRELDDEGRRLAMISANIKRPPKTPWVDLSPAMQRKLGTVRSEQQAAEAAANAVDSTEANSVESEVSDEASTDPKEFEPSGDGLVRSANQSADLSQRLAGSEQADSRVDIPTNTAKRGTADTPLPETGVEVSEAGADGRGDLIEWDAIARHGYSSLDVPTQNRVLKAVAALIHDDKVFRAVIKAVPVVVVDQLMPGKASAKGSLDDSAMFVHALTFDADLPVRAAAIDALVRSPAFPIAEAGLPNPAFSSPEVGAAVSTRKDDGHEAATSPFNDKPYPTQAQIEAGNYQKGFIKLGGLDISIENPPGSIRSGVDDKGNAWSVKMQSAYGYIRGTEGADGDHIDVFVKPGTEALDGGSPVFIVDQENVDGSFDEHKVMLGYGSQEEAERAYLANYTKGWKLGPVTGATLDGFKSWIANGDTAKPFSGMETDAAPDVPAAPSILQPRDDKRPDPEPLVRGSDFRRVPIPAIAEGTPLVSWAKEQLLERGRKTGNEFLLAIDDDGSVVDFGTTDKTDFVGVNAKLARAFANPDRRLVVMHNHPANRPLSKPDLTMLLNPGIYSIWAIGHEGREDRAALTDKARAALAIDGDPADVIAAMDRFDAAMRDAERGLYVAMSAKIEDGSLTLDQASEAHFAAVPEMARRAGLIDFTTNQPYDPANIPMLDRLMDNAALKLARTLLNERETSQASDARVLRSAVAVQHIGELEGVAENRGVVEGRDKGQGGLSERGQSYDQSEAQGRKPRRLTGSRRISENSIVEAISGKWTDLNPTVLATVPLNYFVELARPNMTAVKEYMSVKRLMDAYRGDKHANADAIAGDWLKYMRLGFGKTNKAKAQQLADLMHDSTLAGIDPSLTDDETKAKAGYDILRKRYQALPASGKELFAKVRDAYRAQADELDQILLDNVRKSQQIAKDQAEARYRKKLEEIRDAKMNPIDRRKAEEDAASRYKSESTKMDWSAKARLTKLRIQFESNRVPAPYFPLGRFGQYYVTAKDVDGSVISFSKFERAADRDRFAREIQRDYPGAAVTKGVMKDMTDPRAAMDPRMVAEVEALMGNAGVDRELVDALYQRFLETLPELSMRKRYMHRKGTAGFDTDALRVFSSHMFHAAHQLAKLKYGLELQELVNTTFDQAEAADDQTRAMRLANEMASRHKWVMNPTGGSVAQTMTSTAFVWFLAASPAAAVLNLTQTLMMGLPILGTRFGGIGRASVEVAKASADLISGKGSVRDANLSREEAAAVDAFYRSGMIDRTQSHDLAGVGDTGVKYSPLRSRVMAVMSWAFHNTEVWNRETTALAAYRMARKAGQSHLDAIDSAHDLTWKTHFDYSNSSRPRIMQNDFAKVALVFRSYSINMLYRMFRDIHQSVKGESPQARREARYQLAGVTGMMALMAGVTGTFGFNLMMGVAGLVFGDDDDPMDFEERFKADVIDILGPELGGVVLKGVPGHYMGVDLTSRIGMPDLWFRSPGQDLQGKEEWNYWVSQILGATAGIGEQWFRGASLVMEGDVARGVEVAAPKFIRDPMKAFRYASEGLQSIRGDELLPADAIGIHGAVAQAMGVSPAIVSETWERSGALKNAEKRVMDERQRVVNAWAMAALAKDKEAVAEAIERIKAFNKKPVHSAIPITQDTLKRSIKTRVRNAAKREDGVLIQNEILSQRLRAAMPERLY